MRRELVALCSVVLLTGAACSERAPEPTAQEGVAAENGPSGERKEGNEKKPKGEGGAGEVSGNDGGGDSSSGGDGHGADGHGADGAGSDAKPNGSDSASGGGAGPGAAPYPAAGTYVSSQSGFEEFCQTSSCDRRDLPPEQATKVSYKKRTEDSATVVSETKSSNNREARTTFEFTPKDASIVEVYTKSNFNNVEFSDTYRPDPPIEALRFPLRTGDSWKGEWKDRTSGTYEIAIGKREAVEVAGRTVQAFRIETDIEFRGQFEGRSTGVVWLDPGTKMIVKGEGEVDVKSAFGRYHSVFQSALESGPGY